MAAGGAAMVAAAAELLDGLDVAAREGALLAFDDPRRLRWSYLPGERVGLPMRAMDGDQRLLAHRLLRTALSLPALAQAVTVGAWETVLEAVERRDDGRRDPGRYHVTIFDPPSATGRWGWRFEGHHLSVSVTLQGGVVVAATPLFLGANPARVSFEAGGTLRPLAVEEDLARELHAALDGERRARAVVAAEAPADILSRMSVRAGDPPSGGVAASDLDPAERSLLRRLVRLYTGRLAPEVANFHTELGNTLYDGKKFADATEAFRQAVKLSPDNEMQDGANHIHTVVRDPRGDLDVDPLRAHVAAAHGGDA